VLSLAWPPPWGGAAPAPRAPRAVQVPRSLAELDAMLEPAEEAREAAAAAAAERRVLGDAVLASGDTDGRVCIWDRRRMCRQGEPQELGGGAVHALHAARGLVFAAAAGGGDHQLAERAVYPV
jgi:hypothetical protein